MKTDIQWKSCRNIGFQWVLWKFFSLIMNWKYDPVRIFYFRSATICNPGILFLRRCNLRRIHSLPRYSMFCKLLFALSRNCFYKNHGRFTVCIVHMYRRFVGNRLHAIAKGDPLCCPIIKGDPPSLPPEKMNIFSSWKNRHDCIASTRSEQCCHL